MRIRLSKLFECSPKGVYMYFSAGEYDVPEDMPSAIADRALRSGVGMVVEQEPARVPKRKRKAKGSAPENKALNGAHDSRRLV